MHSTGFLLYCCTSTICSHEIELALKDMLRLRYLRHENICNMFHIIGIPDRVTGFPYAQVCLIMELCDTSLEKLFEELENQDVKPKWKPSEEFTRHWFAQVALALTYIYSLGIQNNDLYERYIIVLYTDPNLQDLEERFMSSVVKIGDFGISQDLSDHSPKDLKKKLKLNTKVGESASITD